MNKQKYSNKIRTEMRKEAKRGEELFIELIKTKNKKSDEYYYECLVPTNEYSPYDIQIQKHYSDDWGDPEISYHEVKVRSNNISYTNYNDSVIDAYKIKQLQKIAETSGKDVYVHMFYESDRTLLTWKIDPENSYDITEYNVKWYSVSLATNEDVHLNKELVYLPNDNAIKIKY